MKLTYYNLFDTKYRELYSGAIINIKKEKDNNTVITINKGRKEYLLPTELIDVLKYLQGKDVNKSLVFLDSEGYNRVIWENNKPVKLTTNEILNQLTNEGKEIYQMNNYGIELIDTLNSLF